MPPTPDHPDHADHAAGPEQPGHPDHPDHPDLLTAATAIRQGTVRLARRVRTIRSAGALSTNKISVLSHLTRLGPSTPGEVAAVDRQQPQSLTRVFAELERDGLITRSAAADDRRQSIITITDAGVEELRRDVAERDAWLAEALVGLSETERQVLVLAAALMEQIADS